MKKQRRKEKEGKLYLIICNVDYLVVEKMIKKIKGEYTSDKSAGKIEVAIKMIQIENSKEI